MERQAESHSEERHRSGREVTSLAEWAVAAPALVPDAVLEQAALVLFDDIAAMVAARGEPELQRFIARLWQTSALGEATVFGAAGGRADRYSAAVANAAAGDWCELDEGYRLSSCHAGLYTLPALLAEAEAGNQGPVELRERHEDVEHELAHAVRGRELLGDTHEVDVVLLEQIEDPDEVP